MSDLPCQAHPELYFAESPQALADAQRLCRGCPVRDLCLAGALERREPYGVWGGEIIVQGEIVPFKRGRGRPRKAVGKDAGVA
ncbi:MAG TPA: WhiB family transcriptional regulator [Marmoricola sp.]|nr:WhiB family transcriptional regulator [Marmoricola sp.]